MTDNAKSASSEQSPASAQSTAGTRNNVARDKVLLFSVVVYFLFLGSLWALYRVGSPTAIRVTIYDVLAKPGQSVEILAKFEHEGPGLFDRDLKGIDIKIGLTETAMQTVTTDSEGVGRITITASSNVGFYPIRAETVSKEYMLLKAHPAGVTVVGKPLLVCDIDDTITEGEGWKLFVAGKSPDPTPQAAEVLTQLASRFQLVFLTARDDSLLEDTRRWLTEEKFPRAPVMGRDWGVLSPLTTGRDKSKTLKSWRQEFGKIPWGIGNSSGDRRAYRENGIEHIIITRDPKDGPGRGDGIRKELHDSVTTYFVTGWSQVTEIVSKTPSSAGK